MKNFNFTLFISFLFINFSFAQDWNLVWEDEFNGSSLDGSKWVQETGTGSQYGLWGWGNGELQYYKSQNTTVSNGSAKIIARQESAGGMNYTSSRMKTDGKFTFRYGKVQAKMKTVEGEGFWPAFWLLPSGGGWPCDGEIDIMEQWANNGNTTVTTGAAHVGACPGGSTYKHFNHNISGGSYADAFHIYEIRWYPNYIAWYVDDVKVYQITPSDYPNNQWPFNSNDWYLILNLAITGSGPNSNTAFPSQLEVDWVRVYQSSDGDYEVPTYVYGCLDSNAIDYNAAATDQALDQWGNTLCTYASCNDVPTDGCMYGDAFAGWHESFGAADCSTYGGTPCEGGSSGGSGGSGCLDANAINYNAGATVQAEDEWSNILCTYASCDDVPTVGCMYANAFAGWHESFGAADCSTYGGTPCEGGTSGGSGGSGGSGCIDSNAVNYDANATVQVVDENGNEVCTYTSCNDVPSEGGCIYATSFGNYNEYFGASECSGYGGTPCDGGTTGGSGGSGCLDSNATNYDASATVQAEDQWGNLVCVYTSCDTAPSEGCVYAESFGAFADGFGPNECSGYGGTPCDGAATGGSGGSGCIDSNATNYNAGATVQAQDQYGNSTCIYASCDDIPDAEGCSYADGYSPFHEHFNAANCEQYGGTACTEGISSGSSGCIDSNATNYNAAATVQAEDQYGNKLCIYASCDDAPSAGGCMYADAFGVWNEYFGAAECSGYDGTPCDGGATGGSGGSGCIDSNATNYNAGATVQAQDQYGNSTCIYASCNDIPDAEGCSYADGYSAFHEHFNVVNCEQYGGTACTEGTSGGSGGSGCLDSNATNYDASATVQAVDQYNNQLCTYTSCADVPSEGCMYADAFAGWNEYFVAADCTNYGGTPCDEGTSGGSGGSGCLDANATNYDASATVQAEDQWGNLVCVYTSCDTAPSEGCVYAESFGAFADGFGPNECSGYGGTPCQGGTSGGSGCLDSNASNYDATATTQSQDQYGNSTCIYASCDDIPDAEGCSYADGYSPFHEHFNAANCEQYGGTVCTGGVSGCTDATALNYNAGATADDGTCDYPCSPAWSVTVTDQNHSIFINGTWTAINGDPLAEGSALGVFYEDSSGNLVCAGYTEISEGTVQIAAMGDDASTEEVDGLLPGQKLVYQVWDVSTCEEFSAVITYTGGPEVYTSNGITFISSVVAAPFGPSCQTLDMPSGWFTLSTYMIATDMDVASILAPIIDNVVIAKNNEGNAYLVEWDFNGIGDLTVGQGYQIKTDAPVSIEVCGDYATPEDHPIDIVTGWNMIGYLRTESAPADGVLFDMNASGNLVIAKDYNGNAYLPEWNFNGIGDMVPGQGYQLKTSTADVLQYLSNDASYRFASAEVTENNVSHFAKVPATGNNMTVVIEDAAWDVLPKEGAEVAAFDQAGHMIGSAIYSSPVTVLTTWGDDATTSSKDGLEASEVVSFKVWTSDEVRDFKVKEWTEGSSSYKVDAINVAAAVSTVNPETADMGLFEAVPNPTSALTKISFYTPKTSFVNITVYNILGDVVEVLTEAQYNKGRHAVSMDTNTLEAGIYFYRLNSDNFTSTKCLTVFK